MKTLGERFVIEVREEGEEIDRYPLEPGHYWMSSAPNVQYTQDDRARRTISLPHPDVDRLHAVIMLSGNEVWLENRGSLKDTIIDGERLPAFTPRRLRDGDRWHAGPYTLTLIVEAEPLALVKPTTLHPSEAWPEPPRAASPEAPLSPAPPSPGGQPANAVPSAAETNGLAMMASRAGDGAPSRYLFDLPAIYQDPDGFLGRYLKIFETIWEPLEQRQDQIALYFDARTAPRQLLPWLADWLRLPLDPELPEQRQRALVHEAYWLMRWRGTHFGLSRLLELATGRNPAISVDPATPYVLVVKLKQPDDPAIGAALIERLVACFKPAHCAYRVELEP